MELNREPKWETCPPVPPEWGREGGKQARLFFQNTVPITTTEVNFAEEFCLCEVGKDVFKYWKVIVFPLQSKVKGSWIYADLPSFLVAITI